MPFDTLAPPPLPAVDVTKTLSAFETTFTIGDSGALRRRNIRAAALRLDGTLILPGATFSFNDVVGSRTKERGFVFAPEIHGDVVSGGVGGGTCQVSSTLFDAALFGALDIVERKSHSRPSTYVKLGLDATVSYPSVDLKLKNPFGFALMIHAYLPRANTLRIELLGAEPVARVTHSLTAGSASDYARLVEPKSWLEPGEQRLRQRGAPGYEVTSVVAIAWPDGRTEERTYFSGYRPTPEILWVSSR
ncbi:MAG: VanW family protein [Polyangiaceae bacterium]